MKLDAESSEEFLLRWAEKEISETTERLEGLLKFLFGVSATSIPAIVAIAKLAKKDQIVGVFGVSIAFFLLSILLLLIAMLRNKPDFGGSTDLHAEYMKDFGFMKAIAWCWFSLWLLGIVFSGLALYS